MSLDLYTPATLTHAVNLIKPETLYLTKILGSGRQISHPTTSVMFDVTFGRTDLAPMGHNGDMAAKVNYASGYKTVTTTPPQIYLEDIISAEDVAARRMAGQSPVTVGSGDASAVTSAFNDLVADKQKNLLNAINRRIEWLFSQLATTGKITYSPASGRSFVLDNEVPAANIYTLTDKWDGTTSDPILQLGQMRRAFAKANGVNPTVAICGTSAADAFRANANVKSWLKSAGVQLLQLNTANSEDLVTTVANIPGMNTIVEYGATYPTNGNDSDTSTTPYIPANMLVLTHPQFWEMHYGASVDLELGDNPIVMAPRYSKMKTSADGKSKSLFVESHPLPVININTGVMAITVV